MHAQQVASESAMTPRIALRHIGAVIVVGACAVGAGAAARAAGFEWSREVAAGVFFGGQALAIGYLTPNRRRSSLAIALFALGLAALGVLITRAVG